jgi:hypothetical protein
LECTLVDLFHWPLNEIDAMDIESLLPFVQRYPIWKAAKVETGGTATHKVFADEFEL